MPQFTFLSSGNSNRTHFTGLLWTESKIVQEKGLAQDLTQRSTKGKQVIVVVRREMRKAEQNIRLCH